MPNSYQFFVILEPSVLKALNRGGYKLYLGHPKDPANVTKNDLSNPTKEYTLPWNTSDTTTYRAPWTATSSTKLYSISYTLNTEDAPNIQYRAPKDVDFGEAYELKLVDRTFPQFTKVATTDAIGWVPENGFGFRNHVKVLPLLFHRAAVVTNPPIGRDRIKAGNLWVPGEGVLIPRAQTRDSVYAWFASEDNNVDFYEQDFSDAVKLEFTVGKKITIPYDDVKGWGDPSEENEPS